MHMDHIGGLLGLSGRLRRDLRIHVVAAEAEFWAGKADLSRATMPPGVPESLRSVAKRFLDEYHGRLQPFEKEHEVAHGMLVSRTGGHTPGHSVVRLESGGDRLMFGGDSVFPPGFDCPHWHNGFDPRARGDSARPGRSPAGARGDPPAAGAHSRAVPGRRPGGGDPRRLSLGTGLLGALTARWVRAELGAAPDRGRNAAPGR
jgi:glyoxylase-like metal-dependent hydrolase (beta-lactamase superfamily II)